MEYYKEKLEFIRQSGNDKYYWKEVSECMKSLQELLDRATPKNTYIEYGQERCSFCGNHVDYDDSFCAFCGQALGRTE